MGRYQTLAFSFLLGSILLWFLSLFQKLMAGYPLALNGFLVPFWAGGIFGLLVGLRHYRVKEIKEKLLKAYNELEHRVKERTAELAKTNEQLTVEIDKRKQAENQAQLEHSRLMDILESIPDGIYIVNQHFNIQYTNSVIEREFGEIQGQKCYQYLHDRTEPCPWCKNEEIFAGKTVSWEWYSSKNDRHYELFDSPLKNSDGSISKFEIFHDITDHKKMESQLRQAQKMEAIGTLAGGIAHDFNNILVPLIGYAEILKGDLPADSPLQGYVDEILKAAFRSADLVKQILMFSRQGDQDIKPIKLQPIVYEALKLLQVSIPTTIEIQQNIDSGCGIVVADPTQFHQIIMNLATNAYHAMEEAGGLLTVTLKQVRLEADQSIVSKLTPGNYALFIVSDTGIGIKKDVMDKIFDPYFTTKASGKGTGLGLAVVHGIVKSCNGGIRIYSEPGKGTEIRIYLPTMDSKGDAIRTDPDEPIRGGNERVLLVDDEVTIISMEQLLLERLGYRVTTRTGSVDALEAFKANPDSFDLIITDMTMPKR